MANEPEPIRLVKRISDLELGDFERDKDIAYLPASVGAEQTFKYKLGDIAGSGGGGGEPGQWLPNTTSNPLSTGVTELGSIDVHGGGSIEILDSAKIEMAGSGTIEMRDGGTIEMRDGGMLKMIHAAKVDMVSVFTDNRRPEYQDLPELPDKTGAYTIFLDHDLLSAYVLAFVPCNGWLATMHITRPDNQSNFETEHGWKLYAHKGEGGGSDVKAIATIDGISSFAYGLRMRYTYTDETIGDIEIIRATPNGYGVFLDAQADGNPWVRKDGDWVPLSEVIETGGTSIWRTASDITTSTTSVVVSNSNVSGVGAVPKANDFILVVNNGANSGKVFRITSVTNWSNNTITCALSDQGTIRGSKGDQGADGLDGNSAAGLSAVITIPSNAQSPYAIDWNSIDNIGTASFLVIDNSVGYNGRINIYSTPQNMRRALFVIGVGAGNTVQLAFSSSNNSSANTFNVSAQSGAIAVFSNSYAMYQQVAAGGQMT